MLLDYALLSVICIFWMYFFMFFFYLIMGITTMDKGPHVDLAQISYPGRPSVYNCCKSLGSALARATSVAGVFFWTSCGFSVLYRETLTYDQEESGLKPPTPESIPSIQAIF